MDNTESDPAAVRDVVTRPQPCPECRTRTKDHDTACLFGELEDRLIHLAKKLAWSLGLNNEERQWVRDCGYPCKDE